MDSHLIAVKVGVKGGTHQWVQLNRFAFNQDRLESLNAQAVKGRCTVQQDRVLFDHLFQNVPHSRRASFNFFLSCLDGGGNTQRLQACKDERLEQF